ncbi:MAG: glycoside hydrolase family 31 protein [Deltaproteobacteria bacterium]|nr:glycoside hydrolase family 31 protein [Deltaproteobacteria bacterium]
MSRPPSIVSIVEIVALGAIVAASLGACGDDDGGSSEPIALESSAATVAIERTPFRIDLHDRVSGERLTRGRAEESLWYERAGERVPLGDVVGAEATPDGVVLRVAAGADDPATVMLRFVTPRTLEVVLDPAAPETATAFGAAWESPTDEAIYGLTERPRDSPLLAPGVIDVPVEDTRPVDAGTLDRRGETVEMFIRPTFSLYAPFHHSSRGYGLAVSGTTPGSYDVAASEPDVVRFRFEAGTTPESRRLRFHLFVGPEHATILDEYTRLTGRPLVPPDWAFLPWRWRGELEVGPPAMLDGVAMNAQLVEDVTMFERLGIPAGVYMLDRPVLEGEFGFARFAWDEERLPNARAMLEALRRRGYRLVTWSSTWTCGAGPDDNGAAAQELGFVAPGPVQTPHCADVGGTSFLLDVTSAEARRWWKERLRDFAVGEGLDGFKLDRGEEHIPSATTDVWADGRNGREVHNDYVVLQTALHYEALAEARPDGDFVLFTRSGYTGTQRHSIVWGGDIPASEDFGAGKGTDLGLRAAILGQLRAAFLGFPIWGSDTGGYYEFKDREVFARWLEFSAFSGIMEVGGVGAHAPWDMPTEPRYDEEMIEIYRRYSRVRVALAGYLAEAAREAGATGMPLARPLVFLDRSDPELRDLWDEWMLGPDFLVAPVWRSGARSREVYFPRGSWRSWWDPSETFTGPARVTVQVPLDRIPVYVREGADVPSPPS